MQLRYKMSKQEWKDLLIYLQTIPNVRLTHYAETDNNGYFVDFCYATIEYNDAFYYLEDGRTSLTDFKVCRYAKLSPYEKQQNAYPIYIHSTEELLDYMNKTDRTGVLSGTHKQRIFLTSNLYTLNGGITNLWRLRNELAGSREKAVLADLESITTIQHTHDYLVLRFHSKDGNYFDYECKSHRITN